MKKIIIAIVILVVSVNMLHAQNDTMYVMKSGAIIHQQSIKSADVDSIIFYRPTLNNYMLSLNNYLKSMVSIDTKMPVAEPNPIKKDTVIKNDTTLDYIYHTDYYYMAPGYDERLVLNPQTDIIYPGALLKGESVLNGTFTPISANRKPLKISTSLVGVDKDVDPSIIINDPKLSTVRKAISELMSRNFLPPPANFGFTTESANNEEQLKIALQGSYSNGGLKVGGGFDYTKKNIQTRLIAKFIQSYYTIDMDTPLQPSDLFNGDVDKTLFGTYMPMYVSSVTYGRIALYTIESTMNTDSVKAFIEAAYNDPTQTADAKASVNYNRMQACSTIKVYVLGGNGDYALNTINGYVDFKNFIINGGNYSKTSPGAIVSYKLSYINDNTIGKIILAASYPVVTAIPRDDNKFYKIRTQLTSVTPNYSYPTGGIFGNVRGWTEPSMSNLHEFFSYPTKENSLEGVAPKAEKIFTQSNTEDHTFIDVKQAGNIYLKFDPFVIYGAWWLSTSNIDTYKSTTYSVPVASILTDVTYQNGIIYSIPIQSNSNPFSLDFKITFTKIDEYRK